jgi:endothelin-converting enzyme/putative endopeptidase
MRKHSVWLLLPLVVAVSLAAAQTPSTPQSSEPALPYSPSLDVSSMDKSIDPCVDFYQYSCGEWQRKNPIPPDQTSWSVYGKLYQDNLTFLRGMLEQAAQPNEQRNAVTQEIGDFYAACMDDAAVEKRGFSAIQPELDAIGQVKSARELASLVAKLQVTYSLYSYTSSMLFSAGSTQDPDDSEQVIAEVDQGGLGMPDRDYYTKDDAKTKDTREHYLRHAQKVFQLIGDSPAAATKSAESVMRLETAMAKASLTRVERRDPHKLVHKMKIEDLMQLAPSFDWRAYYREAQYPRFAILNVGAPDFIKQLNALLSSEPIDSWKTYLRFHVADTSSPYLSSKFVEENFEFYRKHLRGATEMQPRWKRCVQYVNYGLGEALGQVFVAKVFPPERKQSTLEMVQGIEQAMGRRIRALDWMSPETRQHALTKLAGIHNKIGFPDKWRDYRSVKIVRDDFAGNVERAHQFEARRDINKIGKPVDRSEWEITAPTVDAYYSPQMNDINFPAGVLQPPLYDPRMDEAPNYGDTGGTIGHELTHGFDDEGSQFDARGNLKEWWSKEDREKFDARTRCVEEQYSGYVAVDDVHVNGKLTLGENVADLGGEILAYMAWKDATKNKNLQPIDGLTPEQRFFIGFAQWDCANERPEDMRVRAMTDPHSPARYRINGVVVNMPEFARAFSCKSGQPMVKPAANACKVW